jgi:hypothetical protein
MRESIANGDRFNSFALSDIADRTKRRPLEGWVRTSLLESLRSENMALTRSLRHAFQELRPDLVIAFNGRFIVDLSVIESAQSFDAKVFYYESGGSLRDFDFFGHETHDRSALQSRMASLLPIVTDDEHARHLAHEWFQVRNNGLTQGSLSRPARRTFGEHESVVFFTSSTD